MRGCEVVDVNEIANAGSVARWVVATEDRDARPLTQRNLQDQGDQMALGAVGFTASAGCPGRVEVTQTRVAQAVSAVQPTRHPFDNQLRFPVGVGGK